jgi:hypothetical protein
MSWAMQSDECFQRDSASTKLHRANVGPITHLFLSGTTPTETSMFWELLASWGVSGGGMKQIRLSSHRLCFQVRYGTYRFDWFDWFGYCTVAQPSRLSHSAASEQMPSSHPLTGPGSAELGWDGSSHSQSLQYASSANVPASKADSPCGRCHWAFFASSSASRICRVVQACLQSTVGTQSEV